MMKERHPEVDLEVAVLYERGPLAEDLDHAGIPVHCLGALRVPGLPTLWRLRRILQEGKYDVVHTHLFPCDYLMASLAMMCKVGSVLVHTEHNVWNRRRVLRLLVPIERRAYSRFAALVGVSETVCESLRAWLPDLAARTRIIRNGVEVGASPPSSDPGMRDCLLFVGSFRSRVKGFDVLLEALASLRTCQYPLLVVGDGALRPAMERRAARLGLSGRVTFLGHRRNVRSIMRRAALLVVPSRWEGLPMVLLEAMAEGCPVVASAVGGIPEVVENGVTGWLVQPDSAPKLAAQIEAVLESPEELSRAASRAFECVARDWSLAQQVDGTVALYRELVAQARGGGSADVLGDG